MDHRQSANRGIIRTEAYTSVLWRELNAFLLHPYRSGARVVHLHPATSLAASVDVLRVASLERSDAVNVGVAVAVASTPWRDDVPTNGRGIGSLLYGGKQSRASRQAVCDSKLAKLFL